MSITNNKGGINKTAISLFSSGGIGDLAVRAAGWEVLVANELLSDRAELFRRNYPECEMIQGDIRLLQTEIIARAKALLHGRDLDLLFATPPCQGMSKNGRGKLLRGVRDGLKPELDQRNELIIYAINCIKALTPRLVVFENVPEMRETMIRDSENRLISITDLLVRELSPNYAGCWDVIEFADFGVPQRRQRLITIFTRDIKLKAKLKLNGTLIPPKTHCKIGGGGLLPWVSVEEALRDLPKLDAKDLESSKSKTKFHSVPVLDSSKYFWVANTPVGKGAFDNQCVNSRCGFQGNPTHGSSHNLSGVNQSKKSTPIRCLKCKELLPRPWVHSGGEYRLMSGFTSAYKRMRPDLPASALTSNLSYACSDQKIHPFENRVLSLFEAFILHTISDFEYFWERADGKKVSDKSIREVIGESVPPMGLLRILEKLDLSENEANQDRSKIFKQFSREIEDLLD